MKLHVDVFGNGPNLVMLHGWGMHSALWLDLARQLARDYCITLIDLPGHGDSPAYQVPLTLTHLSDLIATHLPDRCHLLGWSLGGLVAQQLAGHQTDRVGKLILVASNVSFVKTDHWPYGLAASVLHDFALRLQQDSKTTLQRFVALQVMGCTDERHLLRHIQSTLRQRSQACRQALDDGLQILRSSDLRAAFMQLQIPLLIIAGSQDRITPPHAATAMQSLNTNCHSCVIDGAGHAPFLSHPDQCLAAIRNHLQDTA